MTLYRFYLIGTKEHAFEKPILYAYTFDKQLSKSFAKYRNMDYFILEKTEIDKKEQIAIKSQFGKHQYITEGHFETKNPEDLGKNRIIVMIPCTMFEEEQVLHKMDSVFYEIGRTINTDSFFRYLKPRYRKLLNTVGFQTIMGFYTIAASYETYNTTMDGITRSVNFVHDELMNGRDDFWLMDNLRVDQLGVFLELFGDTMKIDECVPVNLPIMKKEEEF